MGMVEGGHQLHHMSWDTLKEKIFKKTMPLGKRELREVCQSLECCGCVFCCDKVVRSKLVCMPKGLGQEKANISFAEYRKSQVFRYLFL